MQTVDFIIDYLEGTTWLMFIHGQFCSFAPLLLPHKCRIDDTSVMASPTSFYDVIKYGILDSQLTLDGVTVTNRGIPRLVTVTPSKI